MASDIFHNLQSKTLSAMKFSPFILLIIIACGGSLSDEQRKQMRENMEMNKIMKITEVEITEAAFAEGRDIMKTLERFSSDSAKLDSFLKINEGKVRFVQPGTSNARLLEQQLVDAYIADESGSLQDNVQKVRNDDGDFDTLLYSKPVVRKLPDGSEQLEGVWNIWLPKKELVLGIGKKK